MVTAKTDPKDVVAGLEAGADEYLTKPVDQAALVARVKSMLADQEPPRHRGRPLARTSAPSGTGRSSSASRSRWSSSSGSGA